MANKKTDLKIKIKEMSKKDWNRVEQKKYFFLNINGRIKELMQVESSGIASIMEFIKIKEPLKVNYFNKKSILLEKGYSWVQIAYEKENFWITAIFNKEKKLIQVYFDVSKKNILKQNGESFFYDLFIDVILMDKKMLVLDENELEEAKRYKVINNQEYKLAMDTTKRIMNFLSKEENIDELNKYLYEIFNLLIDKKERTIIV